MQVAVAVTVEKGKNVRNCQLIETNHTKNNDLAENAKREAQNMINVAANSVHSSRFILQA